MSRMSGARSTLILACMTMFVLPTVLATVSVENTGAEPQEEAALQAIPVLETLPLTPRHVHQHVPRGVRWATYFERGVLWMREVPRV